MQIISIHRHLKAKGRLKKEAKPNGGCDNGGVVGGVGGGEARRCRGSRHRGGRRPRERATGVAASQAAAPADQNDKILNESIHG